MSILCIELEPDFKSYIDFADKGSQKKHNGSKVQLWHGSTYQNSQKTGSTFLCKHYLLD